MPGPQGQGQRPSAGVLIPPPGGFTPVGNMTDSWVQHSAKLLTAGPYTGYVLIAGGIDDAGNSLSSAELFNPNTGQFQATGSMRISRSTVGSAALQ